MEDVAHRRQSSFDSSPLRMHAALHHSTNSRNKIHRWSDSDDASRSADHVDHVVGSATGANRIPVRIEGSHRNRDARLQPQFLRPNGRERAGDLIGSRVLAVQLFPNSRQKRIHFYQKTLRRKAAELCVPQPLMPHGANAAFHFPGIANATQRGRDHVTVFQCRGEFRSLLRIVPKPVQQLGKSPLGGVNPAAPLNRLQTFPMCRGGDLGGFAFGAVIAPQVVLAQRLKILVDRNDRGARGVERDRQHLIACNAGLLQSFAHRGSQRLHLIIVRLRRVLRILAFAM